MIRIRRAGLLDCRGPVSRPAGTRVASPGFQSWVWETGCEPARRRAIRPEVDCRGWRRPGDHGFGEGCGEGLGRLYGRGAEV